jgi:hypothetical protein
MDRLLSVQRSADQCNAMQEGGRAGQGKGDCGVGLLVLAIAVYVCMASQSVVSVVLCSLSNRANGRLRFVV